MRNLSLVSALGAGRPCVVSCAARAALVVFLAASCALTASCSLSSPEIAVKSESAESEDGEPAMPSASEVPEPVTTVEWADAVEEFLQFPVLQGGCEVASLSCVLRSMGYDEVDEYTIADEYLEYGDTVSGYSGDPYYFGAAFPPPMMEAADAFLEDKGASERAVDLSSQPFDVIASWVEAGYPVLVWSTMYMEEPELTGEGIEPYEWWDNEHCVVAYGFDEAGDVLVMDPLEGLVVRDGEEFARIYEVCGSLAFVIR